MNPLDDQYGSPMMDNMHSNSNINDQHHTNSINTDNLNPNNEIMTMKQDEYNRMDDIYNVDNMKNYNDKNTYLDDFNNEHQMMHHEMENMGDMAHSQYQNQILSQYDNGDRISLTMPIYDQSAHASVYDKSAEYVYIIAMLGVICCLAIIISIVISIIGGFISGKFYEIRKNKEISSREDN